MHSSTLIFAESEANLTPLLGLSLRISFASSSGLNIAFHLKKAKDFQIFQTSFKPCRPLICLNQKHFFCSMNISSWFHRFPNGHLKGQTDETFFDVLGNFAVLLGNFKIQMIILPLKSLKPEKRR